MKNNTGIFWPTASLRGRIWLLHLACIVPTLVAAALFGATHLGQVALALLVFAALSSLLLPRVLPSIEAPADSAIALVQRIVDGDFSPIGAAMGHGPQDRLAQALDAMVNGLRAEAQRVKAGGAELIRATERLHQLARDQGCAAPGRDARLELDETGAAIVQLSQGVAEISQAVQQLIQGADQGSSAIAELARGFDGIAESADDLVRLEQSMHSTIDEMVDNIGQAKASIVELAETAIETSSRIFEIDDSIATVDHDARAAVAISREVMRDARIGKLAVESALQGMVEIDLHSQSAARVIGGLSHKVEDIGFILNVIKDVADQTALLSLNAAIISAQAGDHGKGFAVVASEIKTLATRTRESINDIASVIDGIQSDTQLAVRAISTASASVKAGETLAHSSNDALEKIVAGVSDAAEQMAGIAGAAKEQARSSLVIREATEQMSRTICEISGVLCFLGDESDQILGATDQIAELVGRLHRATREQTLTSAEVVRATAQITDRLIAVQASCGTRQEEVRRIALVLRSARGAEAAPGGEARAIEQHCAGLVRLAREFELGLADLGA